MRPTYIPRHCHRLIAALLPALLFLIPFPVRLWGQEADPDSDIPSLPIDPSVRMGTLDNGLTYILRRNDTTERGKAHFYLVEKAGSLREEAGEEGMAHFIEKMALTGSLHFSGGKMEAFLERHGMLSGGKFSSDTYYDHTIFRLKEAPVTTPSLTDSILLVLRDWSGGLLLAPKEVSTLQELLRKGWDAHVTPTVLFREKVLRSLLPEGHPYTEKPYYGDISAIGRFTPEALTAFYRKWYRPEFQAVIVVGDIDPERMEESLEKTFGYIRPSGDKSAIEPVSIPEPEAPLGAVLPDPALERSRLTISWIRKALPPAIASSAASLLRDYYVRLIILMTNERLKDLAFRPDPPFESAEADFGPYLDLAANEEALRIQALLITGSDYRKALKAVVTEVKRAVEHGFTEEEFELAKSRIIEEYALRFERLKEVSNLHFAEKYASFFISGGYIPGIELEQKLIAQIAEQVTLKGVNDNLQALISGPDTSILLTVPETSNGLMLPSGILLSKQYLSDYDKSTDLYTPVLAPDSLMARPDKKGYLVSEERGLKYGATRWRLSNGATIFLLPTKHSAGEVLIKGVAKGGFALADAQKHPVAVRAVNEGVLDNLGLGGLTPLQIKKFTDKSSITLASSIRLNWDRIEGAAMTEEVESLLQLIYLRLSRPAFDPKDFERARDIELRHLRSSESRPTPEAILRDSIQRALYPDQRVFGATTERELSHLSFRDFEALYHNHFGNARAFTFFIVGDFDPARLQPLVERYLGNLPSDFEAPEEADYKPLGLPSRSRYIDIALDRPYPFAAATNILVGDEERTPESIVLYDLLADIFHQRYTRTVRNEDPTSEYFEIRPNLMRVPGASGSFISYTLRTDPGNVDRLADDILIRIKSLAASGVEEGEFRNALQNIEDNHNKDLRKNSYWLDGLESYFMGGEDLIETRIPALRKAAKEKATEALRRLVDHNILIQIKAVSEGLPQTSPEL